MKKPRKKRKNRLEFRFALFRFEAKMTKLKRSKNFKQKKAEKRKKTAKNAKNSGKKWKKAKKSEKIDLNFASLCFASKRKLNEWANLLFRFFHWVPPCYYQWLLTWLEIFNMPSYTVAWLPTQPHTNPTPPPPPEAKITQVKRSEKFEAKNLKWK